MNIKRMERFAEHLEMLEGIETPDAGFSIDS